MQIVASLRVNFTRPDLERLVGIINHTPAVQCILGYRTLQLPQQRRTIDDSPSSSPHPAYHLIAVPSRRTPSCHREFAATLILRKWLEPVRVSDAMRIAILYTERAFSDFRMERYITQITNRWTWESVWLSPGERHLFLALSRPAGAAQRERATLWWKERRLVNEHFPVHIRGHHDKFSSCTNGEALMVEYTDRHPGREIKNE